MNEFKTLVEQNCFADDNEVRSAAAQKLERDFCCEINCLEMDHSVQFAHHGRGCTVVAAKICAGAVIFQNVTIGANQKFNLVTQQWEKLGNPVIGKNVVIADGAKVLGPIIIGDGSVVGAGAIITKSVPANSVAFGVNQVRPLDPNYDLVFHQPMPTRDELVAASQKMIEKYAKA